MTPANPHPKVRTGTLKMSSPSHWAVNLAGMEAWIWAVAGRHCQQLYIVTIRLQLQVCRLQVRGAGTLVTHTMWPQCYEQTEIQWDFI